MKANSALGKRLTRCLQAIDRPMTFCTDLVAPTIVPGLQIHKHGPVALPVTAAYGKKLAAVGTAAPYGRGTRTVVDPRVRRVTMFAPKAFHIDHPAWDDWLSARVEEVRLRLGLGERRLKAQLHQMLLYQKGDFFLPHRDGEKEDGMVATMAVVLPSHCSGGDLIVRHASQQERISFDKPSRAFDIQVAAWYADCEHEIEALSGGCRLVLIYNLMLHDARLPVSAPDFSAQIAELSQIIKQWAAKASPEGPAPRLVIPLEHSYSQRGLRPSRLKGRDDARAQALFSAASAADCRAYLAHLTYQEMGEALSDGYDYYGYYDEDDVPDDQVEMGEVFDDDLSAEHWTDDRGKPADFGPLDIQDEEILGGVAELKQEVSEQEFEGYTGNAGMELTRWYHRAALVMWPASQHAEVLCQGSLSAGLAGLEEAVKSFQRRPHNATLHHHACQFATAVMNVWPKRSRGLFSASSVPSGRFASLLAPLADAALSTRYLSQILHRDYQEDPGAAAIDLATSVGWPVVLTAVKELLAHHAQHSLERDARLLATLCRRCPKDAHPQAQDLAKQLLTTLLQPPPRDRDYYGEQLDIGAILESLIAALHQLDAQQHMRRLVTALGKKSAPWDLVQTVLPTVLALAKRRKRLGAWPPFRSLLEICRDGLLKRIRKVPQPPADWARQGITSLDARRQAHYQLLDEFLRDPLREQARFPLRKGLRQDLHQLIEGEQLDTTHVTERRGSPHTLVCRKTDGSYRRARAQHQHESELHRRVVAILAG